MNLYIAAHSILWQDLTIPLYHVIPEPQLHSENFASALRFQGVNHFAGPLEMWLDMSRYDMWRVTARQSKHRLESFFPRQVIQSQMFCRFVIWPFFLFLIERPFDLSTFRIGVPACRQRQAWREKIRCCGQSKLKKTEAITGHHSWLIQLLSLAVHSPTLIITMSFHHSTRLHAGHSACLSSWGSH